MQSYILMKPVVTNTKMCVLPRLGNIGRPHSG